MKMFLDPALILVPQIYFDFNNIFLKLFPLFYCELNPSENCYKVMQTKPDIDGKKPDIDGIFQLP